MDLNGSVAIVTGGNGGLGQRICLALAKAGASVAVVYAQSKTHADEVASGLRSHNVEAEAFACDVTSVEQVDALVASVEKRFGKVDILVNDAAYNKTIPYRDLDALTPADWAKIIDVNLTGPMLCMKAVAPAMRRSGTGRIVNIASVAGLVPQGSSIAYAVSKAGLIHLTRCMSVALSPDILVNCVAPGLLEGTRATDNLLESEIERAKAQSLLKVAADKDDVANQVVTFCRTDTTTGQTIAIDAGRVFH